MALYKKDKDIGPGGLTCPCCKKPGCTKQDTRRLANRRWRRTAKEEISVQLAEMVEEEEEQARLDAEYRYLLDDNYNDFYDYYYDDEYDGYDDYHDPGYWY